MIFNRKFKNGFTLVELLAVIVILAVILAIAIPSISNITNASTKSSFESDAKMLLKAIDYKMLEDTTFDPTKLNVSDLGTSLPNISNNNYQTITVTTLNGKPYVAIEGKNKWNGLVAYGSITNMTVSDSSNYTTVVNQLGYDTSKGVNEPKLAGGMTPIKWDTSTNKWVDTSASDTDWHDYNTKKWANARTADGSMWVWIPRYVYKITSGWHSNTTGAIDVQFSMGIDDTRGGTVTLDSGNTSNASNNKWTNHPGFTFGTGTELTGIWVAKFEASAVEGAANGYTADWSCPIGGDNVTTKTIRIVPNVPSWRCITNSNMFTNIRNMETKGIYGWAVESGLQSNGSFTTNINNIDTHMMKNTEWGAVSYLSKSTYGQGTNEIWINNSQQYITGCAGNSASAGLYDGCQNTYETTNGVKASTTGNVYGIYDISGGSWERTAAYVDNANGNLTGQGSSIINLTSKYKDVYTKGSSDDQPSNYALTTNQKGDALYETSNAGTGSTSWLGDYSSMSYASNPWFRRGGRSGNGSGAGAFAFDGSYGGANSSDGFRPVLVVSAGL